MQGAEIVPLHSSLSDRESLSPKKKKKKEEEVFAGLDVRAAFLGGGQTHQLHMLTQTTDQELSGDSVLYNPENNLQ